MKDPTIEEIEQRLNAATKMGTVPPEYIIERMLDMDSQILSAQGKPRIFAETAALVKRLVKDNEELRSQVLRLIDYAECPVDFLNDKTTISTLLEEVERLREDNQRLINAAKNGVDKLGRFVSKGFLVSHDKTIAELNQAITSAMKGGAQ